MKPSSVPGAPAQAAIAALVFLGMVGGCLILAHSGFGTSPLRGGPSTFVPAPLAYVLAVTMYVMSALGLLALLRARQVSTPAIAASAVIYVFVAVALVWVLRPH